MSTAVKADLSDIHPFDIPTLIDPWDAYARLRDEAPVFFVPEMGVHIVTRYELIMQALRDVSTFSSEFAPFMESTRLQWLNNAPEEVRREYDEITKDLIPAAQTMLTVNPPIHTKYRSLVDRVFTAGRVRKMEPYIQAVIDETIDAFVDDGEIDFMNRFAFPIPLRIISDRLGIPPEKRALFYEGATAAAAGLRLATPNNEEVLNRARASIGLQELLCSLIDARREDPQDDMISILATSKLEDEDRHLNYAEALSILGQFLVAGHETTTSTFGWGMYLLCKHPEVQDEIRGDSKLIRTFVEETLRLQAPVQGLPRLVAKDTELGGYPLKAGDMVILRYGAANRDERQFACPNDLDVHRKNAGSQLAFGSGVHHCVGAPLARQELNLGFPALLERMENFRFDTSKPEPKAEPSIILRSLPELHVKFDKRT